MCGIIGYLGHKETSSLLIEGLKSLEYRGYDSAGVAILCGDEIKVIKQKGYIRNLEKHLDSQTLKGNLGIGHTRWATHGVPSQRNAHPHFDCRGEIALAHNGIIENFLALREELEKKGHRFVSETDTEVIVHLIEENYQADLFEAVKKSVPQLKGSFAFVAISRSQPDEFVAARQDSPLILGVGKDEYFVASDIPALLKHTKDVIILENGEMVLATRHGFKICKFDGTPCQKEVVKVKWGAEAAEKSGFEDFMLKEVFEQPQGIKETLRGRVTSQGLSRLDEGELSSSEIKSLERVLVIACGTSYFAGLTSRSSLEAWAKMPVEVEISSEFRYREAFITPRTLVVAITQSGETADTLAGMREAQKRGAKVIAVTNVVGSTAAREAEGVIYTHAGPEIGVAATKTLTAQMTALLILSLFLARERQSLKQAEINAILSELKAIPDKVEKVLKKADEIKKLAQKFASFGNFLYLGRGVGLPVALEGALKLKEISYIHAEGYPAGEMKHGPIALIDEKMPVVVVATKSHVYKKVLSNIEEVKARQGKVIAIATEGDEEIEKVADHVIFVPETIEMFSPLLAVIPLQLFAYYIAKIRGCNVDQPRNLAKSVTVE